MSILVYGGATGWIGQKILKSLLDSGETAKAGSSRLQYLGQIEQELDEYKPACVINCAGITGRPNVDWCEDHQDETILVNVAGNLNLASACRQRNIHLTIMATGCIYHYDETHPEGSGKGFTEEDEPNFSGSFYSKTKGIVEKILREYENVLVLRLRMPISDDLNHRNFITKITKYAKVVNIPNSMSVLHELLPIAIDMSKKRRTGVYNFTNPGVISHNEVLALYKEYIDPSFTWNNFSVEEHNKVVKALRSNNELDVTKLLKEYPDLPHISQSIVGVFQRMQKIEGKKE